VGLGRRAVGRRPRIASRQGKFKTLHVYVRVYHETDVHITGRACSEDGQIPSSPPGYLFINPDRDYCCCADPPPFRFPTQNQTTLRCCKLLTENKRAGFRARKDEIERRERESRKQTVRMEDKEEMRAAAEAIPVPIGQVPQHRHQHHQQDGGAGGGRRSAGAAAGGVGRGGCRSEQQQRRRRRRKAPLTA